MGHLDQLDLIAKGDLQVAVLLPKNESKSSLPSIMAFRGKLPVRSVSFREGSWFSFREGGVREGSCVNETRICRWIPFLTATNGEGFRLCEVAKKNLRFRCCWLDDLPTNDHMKIRTEQITCYIMFHRRYIHRFIHGLNFLASHVSWLEGKAFPIRKKQTWFQLVPSDSKKIHMKPRVYQLFILDIGHPALNKKFLLNEYTTPYLLGWMAYPLICGKKWGFRP